MQRIGVPLQPGYGGTPFPPVLELKTDLPEIAALGPVALLICQIGDILGAPDIQGIEEKDPVRLDQPAGVVQKTASPFMSPTMPIPWSSRRRVSYFPL